MKILDKKLDQKVTVASKKLGMNKREFINTSVSSYLGNLKKAVDLKKELEMWDFLSSASMRKNKF